MKHNLSTLSIKLILFVISVILLLLPFAIKVHEYEEKYEPRSSLLNISDMHGYQFALIGDSAFSSNYVNDDSDTIWNKFESFSGVKMFPGALDGARKGDIVNAAKYIAQKLPANSTVFIDIIPTRFIVSEQSARNNYDLQFTDLFQEDKFIIYKYLHYLDVKCLTYVPKLLSGKKSGLNDRFSYNRQWNIDEDFAKNRYMAVLQQTAQFASYENMQILNELSGILGIKKINAVFVLTPLNKQEIYMYSEVAKADQYYCRLKEIHDLTLKHLLNISALTIDLFEKVPANCFSDLMHTNACGDEIIAKTLADYSLKYRR
jgi:hypothetical protein